MHDRYQVRYGGLMRCCLESLDDAMVAAINPPKDGDSHRCKYCDNAMIHRNGAWEWDVGVLQT